MIKLNKKQRTGGSHAAFGVYTESLIRRKREAGKENAADLYRTTRNWIIRFNNGHELRLHDIRPGLVDRFADYLQTRGLKPNTVNTYLSNLRAIYNQARHDRLLPPAVPNPFEGISLRRELPGSRALDSETLAQIADLKPAEPAVRRTQDLCLFSFLACGIPFVDLVHLTADNLQNDTLVYKRKKTGTLIRVHITDGMRRLIDKYATAASPYLFPLLPPGGTSHEGYKSILRTYNAHLKTLGACLPHPVRLTSYVFRHTWATETRRKHTPIAIISQALGHTSEKTTRFYLAALEQPELDRANRIITGPIDRIVAMAV